MHNEDGSASQDTDEEPHGHSWPTQQGIGRSLRPGTSVPSRVLVADMGDESVFLQGWRDGPSAHLSPADAVPLGRELAAAFGSPDLAGHGDQKNDADIPAHQREAHGHAAGGTDAEDEQQLIPVACSMHYGPPNFTNLMVTKRGNRIIFDPHVTGSCVIVLEETAATSLFDLLSRWLPMMIDLTTEGNEP